MSSSSIISGIPSLSSSPSTSSGTPSKSLSTLRIFFLYLTFSFKSETSERQSGIPSPLASSSSISGIPSLSSSSST
ncbi:unnamed protein product [Schistosoma mattheei]|uniref:Uncharacterized protein n=1 Tax=Schistosoma mattheei TaxID=31246 RepID=A0A3P8E2X8_9TREM|nr:unnamed protein product [Schistosoma mattheei]